MTKIKLCGLTRPCDMEWANALTPDYIGFVFAGKSRRYVSPERATALREQLNARAAEYSREGRLNISIQYDDPEGFDSRLAHYGRFRNVNNYIVLAGAKDGDFDYRCGYWGERLVLYAQQLGLNTCWVALTHGKSRAVVGAGEREVIIIALGYGRTQGSPHRSKAAAEVSNLTSESPEWFRRGVEAALLAPTAVNQQKFRIEQSGNTVTAKAGRFGTQLRVDLGIVKCHFELGAGKEHFKWAGQP